MTPSRPAKLHRTRTRFLALLVARAARPGHEDWYDAEIAPALATIADACVARGVPFVAVVEYAPGERGRTFVTPPDAGIAMVMLRHCAKMGENVDGYMLGLFLYCRKHGIDMGGSIYMALHDPKRAAMIEGWLDGGRSAQRGGLWVRRTLPPLDAVGELPAGGTPPAPAGTEAAARPRSMLSPDGTIELPTYIREALGIHPGEYVYFVAALDGHGYRIVSAAEMSAALGDEPGSAPPGGT